MLPPASKPLAVLRGPGVPTLAPLPCSDVEGNAEEEHDQPHDATAVVKREPCEHYRVDEEANDEANDAALPSRWSTAWTTPTCCPCAQHLAPAHAWARIGSDDVVIQRAKTLREVHVAKCGPSPVARRPSLPGSMWR